MKWKLEPRATSGVEVEAAGVIKYYNDKSIIYNKVLNMNCREKLNGFSLSLISSRMHNKKYGSNKQNVHTQCGKKERNEIYILSK